jgi:hypothetical protein
MPWHDMDICSKCAERRDMLVLGGCCLLSLRLIKTSPTTKADAAGKVCAAFLTGSGVGVTAAAKKLWGCFGVEGTPVAIRDQHNPTIVPPLLRLPLSPSINNAAT